MSNRLANETSPYLLQHAGNPVAWYPWGEEALRKAREENKPILLSIGYAACHWCHVMAHESFEDAETAAFMNEHFVNVKVDREERPDLDSIYMNAVVAMTGQGGWPMTVVLTPDGEPFFGGTYFPRTPRYGMPSFKQVLGQLARAWQERREEIAENATQVSQHLSRLATLEGQANTLSEGLFQRALAVLERNFDGRKGGFGRAPKFPQAMAIEFLLRRHQQSGDQQALPMAELTLEQMAYGGMYDQVGGGFARYSTDDEWLVPHFEKMLYDNGLLARAYLHAWRVTGRPLYRRIVEETLDWMLREMRHPDGGFYSSLDADSEGEEGRFYVWEPAEIRQILGDEARLFMDYYGVSEGGNWEGKNILHVSRSLEEVAGASGLGEAEAREKLAAARQKMYAARARRVWPGLDDKVLTAWNGLALAALAEAGRDLDRPDYTQAAVQNAEFLYQTMRQADGRLRRTWKAGVEARYNAYLEDYAYLADALLALYQNTFEERWFRWAGELTGIMMAHFQDEANGGFFDTSDDHEALIYRPKDLQDNATPSGNAMAAYVLLQLSLYTGNGDYWDVAEKMVSALYGAMAQYPTGFAHWLCAATFILGRPREVAIAGDPAAADTAALVDTVFAAYRPHLVVAVGDDGTHIPLLAGRERRNGRATAYVCYRFACQAPVTTAEELAEQLEVEIGE
ncbi:MAG: thioredoxin domain-containing protein [Chloroflexi bacterium]|nr:thioredoxin domain-containing protein [Chloroflexota bacterium]MCI0576934.1 thioredoxin domain-containing protein [Chloroflexota bacterium]MCI0646918.1 thioredoxin domain-containing protein [Chloroflexota bacterium]MCI0731318.1 thioredoxin domain-containing protein [Chloroflexota bacterium]